MFIANFDFLSPKITLFYERDERHSSIASGIVSICLFILILVLVAYLSIDFLFKKNPTSFYFHSYENDLGKFELTDYARMLYLYTYDRDEYKKKLNEFDYDYVILDFNIILLDYLRCEKIEEKAGFIEEIAIPYLQISSNKYLEAFFIIEASKCKVAKGFKGVKYMIEKLKLQNYYINFEDGVIFETSQNNN